MGPLGAAFLTRGSVVVVRIGAGVVTGFGTAVVVAIVPFFVRGDVGLPAVFVGKAMTVGVGMAVCEGSAAFFVRVCTVL